MRGIATATLRRTSRTSRVYVDTNAAVPRNLGLFEDVAEKAFQRHERLWKPGTLAVSRSYLRNQLLPWFCGRSVADITAHDVRLWFAGLHETPAAADRSLPILSLVMREAESEGYRPAGTNPCAGIQRYRPRGRARFLTASEMGRLGKALAENESAGCRSVAAIRLLALTGCRQGEIRTLRWQDYREGHLFLPDSKSGARTIWLSSAARIILDSLPTTSTWIFPAVSGTRPMSSDALYGCWRKLRTAAALGDVRLHDLRHTYASFALRQGETIPMIGRLLGHRDPVTTLRYTHFADAAVRHAGEVVGEALSAAT